MTITGYQKPNYFEFLSDNVILERNRLEFKDYTETNSTIVTWSVYSRRKNVLFKVRI